MINFLEKKLENRKLTKTEKIIADFFYENKNKLFFLTSSDIAQELNISDSSVIRFVKSLDFNNFKEFKDNLKQDLSEKILTPVEKLSLNQDILQNSNMLNNFINIVLCNINSTLNEDVLNKIEEIKKILFNSNKKYVVGFKSTSGPTSFFGLRLGFIFKDVFTHSVNSSTLIKDIFDISENDCLFLIAHPKYSKTYNLLVEIAKKNNAKIIILTDKATSPVANLGDVTVYAETTGASFFNSIISTQTILEYILTDLSKNIDVDSRNRLKEINELLNMNKL